MKSDLLKTLGGIALGGVAVVILAGFLFVADLEKARRSLIIADSFCPVDNSIKVWGFYEIHPPKVTRKIAVVIDATDQIPVEQQNEIADWFKYEFVSLLDRFALVTIYQLDEIISDKTPQFEKCAPPSSANPWVENQRLVRKSFEKNFLSKLLGVVKSLASSNEKDFSPILEMTEKMFDSHDEIIFVSDLMHHTPGCSLYKSSEDNHDYDHFSSTTCAAKIAKNRQGKKLTAIYIIRQKLKRWQNESLLGFWHEHMENDSGEFVVAKILPAIGEK